LNGTLTFVDIVKKIMLQNFAKFSAFKSQLPKFLKQKKLDICLPLTSHNSLESSI